MNRKYYNKKIYLLYLILLFLFSCTENENETEINLGNGFFYIPSQEIIFDVTTFYGNGIYLYKNHKKIPVILPKIEKYQYNSEYIIVMQTFDIEQTNRLIKNMLFMPNVYFTYDQNYINLNNHFLSKLDEAEQNSINSEKFTEELLKNTIVIQKMKTNKENFYLISKKEKKIFGPLAASEFTNVKKELKINLDFE